MQGKYPCRVRRRHTVDQRDRGNSQYDRRCTRRHRGWHTVRPMMTVGAPLRWVTPSFSAAENAAAWCSHLRPRFVLSICPPLEFQPTHAPSRSRTQDCSLGCFTQCPEWIHTAIAWPPALYLGALFLCLVNQISIANSSNEPCNTDRLNSGSFQPKRRRATRATGWSEVRVTRRVCI